MKRQSCNCNHGESGCNRSPDDELCISTGPKENIGDRHCVS